MNCTHDTTAIANTCLLCAAEQLAKAEARVAELEAEARTVVANAVKDAGYYRVPRRDLEMLADLVPLPSVCSDPEPDEVKVLESPDPAYQKGSIIRGPSFGDPKRIVTGIVYGQHSDGLDEWWVDTVDPDEKPSNMVLLTQPIEVLRFASEMAIKYRDYFPKSEPEKSCTNEATLSRDRARLIIAQARAAGDALDFGAGLETKIMAALDAPSVDNPRDTVRKTAEELLAALGFLHYATHAPAEDEWAVERVVAAENALREALETPRTASQRPGSRRTTVRRFRF